MGLDATAENIESASERLSLISEPLRLRYSCSTVEDLEEEFDLVVASEVIEHVSSLDMFLDACVSCTKVLGLFRPTIMLIVGGIEGRRSCHALYSLYPINWLVMIWQCPSPLQV